MDIAQQIVEQQAEIGRSLELQSKPLSSKEPVQSEKSSPLPALSMWI